MALEPIIVLDQPVSIGDTVHVDIKKNLDITVCDYTRGKYFFIKSGVYEGIFLGRDSETSYCKVLITRSKFPNYVDDRYFASLYGKCGLSYRFPYNQETVEHIDVLSSRNVLVEKTNKFIK